MLSAILNLKFEKDRIYIEKLYLKHFCMLKSLASAILHDNVQGEIVVIDAMLSLFSLVPKLKAMEEQKLIAYLRATVRNAAYKQYNAQKSKNLTESVPYDSLLFSLTGPEQEDPASIAIRNEEYRQVREAIAALPETDRQVLYLKYSAGFTSREIAQMIDAPSENAVNVQLSRARHKVLRLLEDRGWVNE